jgi:ATP-dependent DNA helicase RecG
LSNRLKPPKTITKDDFKKDRIITMKYLNRRIGDFLKELHLTEGKGTGIPKIKRAMKNNGSDEPIFETDESRTYFVTILKAKLEESNLSSDRLRPIALRTISGQLRTIRFRRRKNYKIFT